MIAVLVCDRDEKEGILLDRECRDMVAECCEEDLRTDRIPDDAALLRITEKEQLVNLLYYSFRKGQSVHALRVFRKRYGGAMLMLVADPSVSPLEYLRPGVSPDSLVFRPLKTELLREANREFVISFLERLREPDTAERFLVDTREEKVLIPCSQIYYFEARDKKIFLRTCHEEYAFYDTMDNLESRLPDMFRRCHRSYIVNTGKIMRILPVENCLKLTDEIGVPVSRRYRAFFRVLGDRPAAEIPVAIPGSEPEAFP